MPLVKLIISKKINELMPGHRMARQRYYYLALLFSCLIISQDNSPYSRYGLGDIVPSTNINSRGMGSISARL